MIVMDNLLTVKEVAEALRVSEETIKRWLRQELIPGIKTGKSWRIRESTLADLKEHGTPTERKAR